MRRIAPQTPADPAPPSLLMWQGRVRRFRRRFILIAVVSTVLILGLAAIVGITVSNYRQSERATLHSFQVEKQILLTGQTLFATESALRGYLLSGDTEQLETYLTQHARIDSESAELVRMTSTDARLQQHARDLRRQLQQQAARMQALVQAYRDTGHKPTAEGPRIPTPGAAEMRPILLQMDAMRTIGHRERARVEQQRAYSARLTTALTLACLACALLLMAVAVILVIREQRNTLYSKEALMQAYLQLAQSLEESRGMADRMQRLHALSEILQSCRSMDEALQALPPSLEDMFPDTAGAVLLVNASRNLVEIAASWGTLPWPSESVFTPDDCFALRRGQPYPDADVLVKMPCAHLSRPPKDTGPTAWICIPLLAQGETLGVLHLQTDGEIGPELRDLAITLGEQLGLLLGNIRLQDSLRIQSIRDPLTGLFNRRYLESSLRRELLRNARHGRDLTVLMMDLDHFKQFNDVHGHDAGDELLQQFAAMLRDQIRSEDIPCRYGGEEFTVILPETGPVTGRKRAEDIRRRTTDMKIRSRGMLLGGISVTIGVASQSEHGPDAEDLLHAADQALYRAKRAGRNRVEAAVPQDHRTRPKGTD